MSKTIKLRIALPLLFTCLLFSSFAQSSTNFELSDEEKEYLSAKGRVTMCVDPNWMPYERINKQGKHVGIAADFMSEFQKGIPVPIELVQTESWKESLEAAKSRQCDILSLLNESPQRREFLNFTDPYLTDSVVIVTKKDVFYLDGLKSLSGRKLGIVEGYVYEEKILKQYPEIEIVSVKSIGDALRKVSDGKIYATLDALFIVTRHINDLGLSNLKIASQTGLDNVFRIGVRKDDPILLSVFDKVIKNLDDATRNAILRSWYTIKFHHVTDWIMVWQVTGIAIIILCLLGYNTLLARRFNRKLAEANKLLLNNNQELDKRNIELRDEIVERRRVELDLGESFTREAMLADIVRNASVAIGVGNPDYRIGLCNQAFQKLTGYSQDELDNMLWNEILTPPEWEEVESLKLTELHQTKKPVLYEKEYFRKDGTRVPVEIIVHPRLDNNGNILSYFGFISDLTDRKRAEVEKEKLITELKEVEHKIEREKIEKKVLAQSKLASLGQLATGVAHEINQPLTHISMTLQVLLDDLEKEQLDLNELADDTRYSLEQVSRITQLIEHLRLFGRDSGTVFGNVNLKKVTKNTLILMGQRMKLEDIEYNQNSPKDIPAIRGNAIQLEQVLINLLQNSIDALKGNKNKKLSVTLYSEKDAVKIKVSDNAGGIPVNIQERIFEPFFTTKEPGEGTGIGLSIVYGIIKEHKGDISYIPVPGGSSFLITLPCLN